jgi:predicted nucleotidyltransferase
MTTLLRGVVGSHAYGLNHADSDVDRMEVFAAPTLEVAGLSWHSSKESRVKQGPDGDDFSAHEVGKFLRLVLKANPTVTELLWLTEYEEMTYEGSLLVSTRSSALSRKAVVSAYRGYADSQLRKYKDGFTKVKYARHCMRLVDQGFSLYRDGFLQVRVDDPTPYFELADMTSDQVLDRLTERLKRWEDYTGTTPLPEEPDIETLTWVLNDIRTEYLEG